jgi:Cyclic nucleotide-binding domain
LRFSSDFLLAGHWHQALPIYIIENEEQKTTDWQEFAFVRLWKMSTQPGQSKELVVSTLCTAQNRLEYLTLNDWTLIIDRAEKLTFKKHQVLIEQGKQLDVVYIIASGRVSVSASGGLLAQLSPGQICGEMAFLESGLASARATAEENVEAYALRRKQLMDLFELFPHLASRFYRSVAVNLSRRLREQIANRQRGA